MSSIYDNKKDAELLDGGKTSTTRVLVEYATKPETYVNDVAPTSKKEPISALTLEEKQDLLDDELAAYQERSRQAMELVDDIVLKNYLTKLSDLEVVPCKDSSTENLILVKVNKMVYEKDEYATDKFISVISAMTFTDSSIYLIVDGHKEHTDFYMGIKCHDEKRTSKSIYDTFKSAMQGQFPGAQIGDNKNKNGNLIEDIELENSRQRKLLHHISEACSLTSCVGIPAYKNSKGEYTNANFIQGIEKFALAMQGKEYTAIVLASNIIGLNSVRSSYEDIYTNLSSMATQQVGHSKNYSSARNMSVSEGYSDGTSFNISNTETSSDTNGESKDNAAGKAAKFLQGVGGALSGIGNVETFADGHTTWSFPIIWSHTCGSVISPLVYAGAACQIGGAFAALGAKTLNKSHTDALSATKSEGTSHTDTTNFTDGTSTTEGVATNYTITIQNKRVQEILKRIDKQLERISTCEGTGLWSASAYFMSYGTDRASAEIGATIFRSIMLGEQSGVETSAINTWYPESGDNYVNLLKYICTLSHPTFIYKTSSNGPDINLVPTSLLSSKELAIMMGLPRKSVPGFPVIEHVSLGKEIVRLNTKENGNSFELGCIFDQGVDLPNNKVLLDTKSLTQHTFVTGSTGCGKSETVYKLIDSVRKANAKFLIIEPAKGEYKNVFGTEHIFGTNPLISNLFKINPFKFTDGVHVLEHADKLIEIFNVCWPMYAAMPVVLKEAVLNSYEDCGWDLIMSKNKYSNDIFPTFSDLIWELEAVIEASSYSEEVKSNYKGSLVTRVKSLANGIYGEIFSGREIGDKILFDENVIIDLSRIGSQETKSLIMGVIIMRLNEYRANSGIEANSSLRHVTILEEAHNILKRCSQEQSMEGSNVAGKSVEMISNAIAEMRTYGEGFIIVDQSPGAVDISAIRNTNTKIVMRLPEDSDRKIAGKSAAMKDNQVDEIAKLPTGVAVVYQNDWEEPVLCHINMFDGIRLKYEFMEDAQSPVNELSIITEILRFMMKEKISQPNLNIDSTIYTIKNGLSSTSLPTYVKLNIFVALQEYEETGTAAIWKNNEYEKFSWIISGIFASKHEVIKLTKQARDFDDLTEGLKKLIKKKNDTVPSELELSICQSLMRDYSMGDENRLKIYNAWLQKTKSKIK